MRIDDEDAELVWEIDLSGRLSVEKIDESGSAKIWLGPVTDVLATLADFLKIASADTHPEGGDVERAPFMGSAVAASETPSHPSQSEGESPVNGNSDVK